jgi:hypothetical protein
MDSSVQRLLNDKLYEKRKQGALEYVIAATFVKTMQIIRSV